MQHEPASMQHRLSIEAKPPEQSLQACLQIPGDGRELVVTDQNALTIRAEDGRRVAAVNITPYINNLPFGERVCSVHVLSRTDNI